MKDLNSTYYYTVDHENVMTVYENGMILAMVSDAKGNDNETDTLFKEVIYDMRGIDIEKQRRRTIMWSKLSLVATVGSIIFGLLTTLCDIHEAKDKLKGAK